MALPGGKHLGAWCAVEYGHEAGRVQGRALPRWAAPAWPGREPWRALPSSQSPPGPAQIFTQQGDNSYCLEATAMEPPMQASAGQARCQDPVGGSHGWYLGSSW
jgi:hypothetical protein